MEVSKCRQVLCVHGVCFHELGTDRASPTTINTGKFGKTVTSYNSRQLFPSGRKLFQGLHLPIGNLIAQGVVDIYNHRLQTFIVKMYKALELSNAIYGEHILYLRTAPYP